MNLQTNTITNKTTLIITKQTNIMIFQNQHYSIFEDIKLTSNTIKYHLYNHYNVSSKILNLPTTLTSLITIKYKNQTLKYYYDRANRLNKVETYNSTGILEDSVIYHYDEPSPALLEMSNLSGRLSWTETENVNTYFSYDNRGRRIKTVKEIDSRRFMMNLVYDNLDRVVKRIYPDGFALNISYNERSLIDKLGDFVNNSIYNEFGLEKEIQYGNSIDLLKEYDEKRWFLKRIQAPGLIDLNYDYDKIGNISSIINLTKRLMKKKFK